MTKRRFLPYYFKNKSTPVHPDMTFSSFFIIFMEIKIVSINGQLINNPKIQKKDTNSKTFFYDETFEDYKKDPFFFIEESLNDDFKMINIVVSIEYNENELSNNQIVQLKQQYEQLED